MLGTDIEIRNISELRDLVYQILCEHEQLEPGVFPMTERILKRGGRPCGMYFCLHGPRNVTCTSIWETDSNTILFYGHLGQRFRRTVLARAPQLTA